jgi:hypothetical protein
MIVYPFQKLVVGTTLEEQQQQQLQNVSQFVAFSIFIGIGMSIFPLVDLYFCLSVSVCLCNKLRMPLSVVGNKC